MKHLLLAIIALLILSSTQAQRDSTDFVTTWRTTNFGLGGDSSVVIPIDTNYTYNFDVDWDDDGIFDDLGVTDTISHQYLDTGTYTIRIRGTFPRYFVRIVIANSVISGDEKLISLDQWGDNSWQNVEYMFRGIRYFTYNAVDTPNLSQVTSLRSMFEENISFNGDLSNWNVANITNLYYMFKGCHSFNQPLNSWGVSNVTDFSGLFWSTAFNQPLNLWDMSNAKSLYFMFNNSPFNQPIDNWNVSNVTNMSFIFEGGVFNQPINSWQVDSVTFMTSMFKDNVMFNQPLNNWNTSNVRSMSLMFSNATSFNQPLNNWNTMNVYSMFQMFSGATSFNQDIGSFDLSSIRAIPPVTETWGILDYTNLSTANYDSTLIKWARQNPQQYLKIGAIGLNYCAADSARNYLTRSVMNGGPGWAIFGDTLDCLGVGVDESLTNEKSIQFMIYPNPNKGKFTIDRITTNKIPEQELLIYNIHGQIVYSKTITQSKDEIQVNGLKGGIYLLRLDNETRRVVVE